VSQGGPAFWNLPEDELLAALATSRDGLSSAEAASRLLRQPGLAVHRPTALRLFVRQLASPIVAILLLAAVLSFGVRDVQDASIIIAIVLVSAGLGFWQEYGAANAVAALLATVQTTATVMRDGRETEIPVAGVVPGDVVVLDAGARVPGDCRVLEARDLHVIEAALTGESFPVEKEPGTVPAEAPLVRRSNALYLGTHVASGTGRAVVARTGKGTEFGAISERLRLRAPETEFERGVRRFGFLLAEVTLLLVIAIFAFNVALDRPVLEAFLFSLALAVGLTPQLLPAIISVNLSHGARRLARRQVVVKRLSAIENLGSMDVLCADKTGTLTEGSVRVHSSADPLGTPTPAVLRWAALNAAFETGFRNPIDTAIRDAAAADLTGWQKLDEIPYDFVRKRLSVLVLGAGHRWIVTKGAIATVLEACTSAELADGSTVPLAAVRSQVEEQIAEFGARGLRTIAVAIRDPGRVDRIERDDERDMTLVGLVSLLDPPKAGAREAIERLRRLGVTLKIISGDSSAVAVAVARAVGMAEPRVLAGTTLRQMSDEALLHAAPAVELFAEVEPNQKERVILALKKAGHVVGYLGDGINDASSLHAADVGLSVDGAVDVAKEAADIVLMRRDLAVIAAGVREGRRTFANTLKYVFMATSANFGNMFSMAGASLFLAFLPLLPKQILLTNLLTDLPEMAIARDHVDAAWVERPHRWDVRFIRNFMLVFGALSSVFDYATFGVLLWFLRAGVVEFRTGWFVESVVSAACVVLVVRSRGPAFSSRPGGALLAGTIGSVCAAVALPFTPLASPLGFQPVPPSFLAALAALVVAYVASAEAVKRLFYARDARRSVGPLRRTVAREEGPISPIAS
jgi:Mg2+-importing ATPase